MFDVVTTVLAADKIAGSGVMTYKDKVESSTTTKDVKKEESNIDAIAVRNLKEGKFEGSALESDNADTVTGIVVYKSKDETIKGARVVNNVTFVEGKQEASNVVTSTSFDIDLGWN